MQVSRPAIVSRNSSAPAVMANPNPSALAYSSGIPNQINSNNMLPTMPTTQMPQHQQYQQGPIVSPTGSPRLPREQILGNQNHQVHVPNQLGNSPGNINNHNTMAWQHRQHPQQLQLQINPARSYESEDFEKTDNDSDVSSIHMGSIRPDPNYDPAKDPTSPENIDIPFVAPLEITIRVVKGRRRKTVSSYHSSSTHTTSTTHSTILTPPHPSAVEAESQIATSSDWLHHVAELPTTQTGSGSIPQLGPINSFVSDATDSNSFSGSTDQFQSAEERMYMEEDLLELQGQNNEETKQRKGMVRREFNRRIMRFKKSKKKNKNISNNNIANNNNINTSHELSGDDEDDGSDASGNKIIIKLKIDDTANSKSSLPEQAPPKQHFKPSFGGMLKHHRRSNSMQMVVDQENGC